MKINKRERYRIYKRMLNYFLENQKDYEYAGGFCFAISFIYLNNMHKELLLNYENRMYYFPELLKYRPIDDTEFNGYWFHRYDKQSRIDILKEILTNKDKQQ